MPGCVLMVDGCAVVFDLVHPDGAWMGDNVEVVDDRVAGVRGVYRNSESKGDEQWQEVLCDCEFISYTESVTGKSVLPCKEPGVTG